jgi:hypothetical protein
MGEVRLSLEAAVAEPKIPTFKEPPAWLTVACGLSSVLNLTASLLIINSWRDISEVPDGMQAWQYGVLAANVDLGWPVYACFLAGALLLVVFGVWALLKFPKMRAHGPWSLLFIAIMMFNFNFSLFLRLGARTEGGDAFPSRAKAGFYIFLILGALVSGFAAMVSIRTKAWRPPVFKSSPVKWMIKITLGLGILLYGIAPLVSVGFKHPTGGFILALVSFTMMKVVMLATLIMNLVHDKRNGFLSDENRPLLVDQTTAT